MTVVLRNEDFERACTIMDNLNNSHTTILGVPKFSALSLFVDHCIKNKSPTRALVSTKNIV